MNYRQALNIVLLLFIGLIFAAVYFKPEETSNSTPISALDAASINSLKLKQGEREILLTKSSGEWFVAGNPPLPAGEYRVKEILRLLSLPSEIHYPADEMDLMALGLEPAETVVNFDNLSVALGDTNPIDQKRYLLVDDTVHLIESFQVPTLTVESQELISKKLIQYPSGLSRIDAGDYLLEKQEVGWHWPTATDEISADEINAKVQSWLQAQAYEVKFGRTEGEPIGELILEYENQDQIRYEILTLEQGSLVEWIFWRADWDLSYLFFEQSAKDLLTPPVAAEASAPFVEDATLSEPNLP